MRVYIGCREHQLDNWITADGESETRWFELENKNSLHKKIKLEKVINFYGSLETISAAYEMEIKVSIKRALVKLQTNSPAFDPNQEQKTKTREKQKLEQQTWTVEQCMASRSRKRESDNNLKVETLPVPWFIDVERSFRV